MNLRTKLTVLAALAVTGSAFAEIKINDNLSTSGYIVGSYQYADSNDSAASDSLDLDAAKVLFSYNFAPVTGTISFYHGAGGDEDLAVLDAYATYDFGTGFTMTGGKFLSYLGYEAFDLPNLTQLSWANGALGVIPGYHTGVKIDYSDDNNGFGLAVVDSVYGGGYLKGDSELKDNVGFEAYYSYKGIKGLTVFAGLGYESENDATGADDVLALDFWASYNLTDATYIAGEFANKDGGNMGEGYNWLALVGHSFSDKFSGIVRVSGEKVEAADSESSDLEYTKYTIAPTWTITPNLKVIAEYSYTDYKGGMEENYAGVRGFFTF